MLGPARDEMKWSVIVAANSDEVLQECLLSSPDITKVQQIIVKRGFASAGLAYNSGLEKVKTDVVVLAHQDVFLPRGWANVLAQAVEAVSAMDPCWAVLGTFGIGSDRQTAGYVYSTGLKCFVGAPFSEPVEASSLDEMVLVLRRSSGLRFDPQLPGFHFYGTDICLEAMRKGMRSYIVPAVCLHNSNGIRYLPVSFWHAYLYMRRKWWGELPVRTPCTEITRLCMPMIGYFLEWPFWYIAHGHKVGRRLKTPELAWDDLSRKKPMTNETSAVSAASCRPCDRNRSVQ